MALIFDSLADRNVLFPALLVNLQPCIVNVLVLYHSGFPLSRFNPSILRVARKIRPSCLIKGTMSLVCDIN